MKLPVHLGGHKNRTHTDAGVLKFFKNYHGCLSMIDIGCGPGGQLIEAKKLGYEVLGIDGDFTLKYPVEEVIIHDYTKAPLDLANEYDLGWCIEFLEHVEEDYIPNYMATMKHCKYIVVTHALPGEAGHYHVNCQTHDYWIKQFKNYNFNYSEELTQDIKTRSTMSRDFIRRRGLVFIRNY